MRKGMVYKDGTNTCTVAIPNGHGQVVAENVHYTSPGAGTLVVYRPKQRATANAAASSSTTLVVDTDALGKIGGAVLTTSDYLLVCHSGASGWQLSKVNAVAAVSSSTVSLTLATAVTLAAGDAVFVARAADIVTLVTGTETVRGAENMFNGFLDMPVAAVLAATGTCRLSVVYAYWRD